MYNPRLPTLGPYRFKPIAVAGIGTWLAACSVVSSSGDLSEPAHVARQAEAAYSLPRTVFNVKADKTSLVVTKATEPDPGGRMKFKYQSSAFSDDDLLAEVAEDGLLKSVSATAKDRSGDIAVNIAETVFTIGTAGAPLPSELRSLPAQIPGVGGFTASYDPLDPTEAGDVRQGLAKAGYCIVVGQEATFGSGVCPKSGAASTMPSSHVAYDNPARHLLNQPGIYYRQPTPEPVRIYRRDRAGWNPVFVGNETLFDKSEVYQVAVDRAAFVEKKVELTFQSGALTKVHVNKPSELFALSTAGLKIVKIALAIPLEALNQNATLTNAKAAKIQAETTLLQRQDELLKLQVEQGGSTQGGSLVRSNVDFIAAGARSLGAVDNSGSNDLAICQTNLGAAVTDCRALIKGGT